MILFLKTIFYYITFVFLIILIGLLIPSKQINENIHYSIYDKHELLKGSHSDKRLIFIGGSNLPFGLYSPAISDSLNIEVINAGIHAGYGLKYIIDDIKPLIRKGDRVVLIGEYEQFLDDAFWGQTALIESINIYPSNLNKIDLKQGAVLLRKIPRHALKKILLFSTSIFRDSNPKGVYQRSAFNKNGDIIAHWNIDKKINIEKKMIEGSFNQRAIDYILDFSVFVKENKAELYLSFPSVCSSSYNKSKATIDAIYKEMKKSKISILGSPEQYSFSDTLYFDSYYHLHKEGQIKRTNLLIKDLKNKI